MARQIGGVTGGNQQMNRRNRQLIDIQTAIERVERLQHAQHSALQSLAERLDRLTAMLEADTRHSLVAPQVRAESAAISLARSGARLEDLVRNCGLRTAEAELLLALYGRANTAASVTRVA
jgi:hypothetical protein